MHNFKELKVWKNSIQLAKDVYILTADFPTDEKFGLVSQMKRCAISVASNIAEGSSRSSNKAFLHFLEIAVGSLFELETQLTIAKQLEIIHESKSGSCEQQIIE